MIDATRQAGHGSADGGSEAEGGVQCPECDFVGKSVHGLFIHFTRRHKGVARPEWIRNMNQPPHNGEGAAAEPRRSLGAEGPASASLAGGPAPKPPAELEQIRKDFEAGMATLGGLVFIAGLRTTGVVIERRAQVASFEAIAYAQRSPAVMRAVVAFNGVMQAGKLAELTSAVALGVGVDVGALHPARSVKIGPVDVPGFVILRPIEADMMQVQRIQAEAEEMGRQYAAQMAQAAAAAAANGRAQDAAAAAAGE